MSERLPVATLVVALAVVVAGCAGGPGTPTPGEPPGDLEAKWVSDTGRDIKGNHHAAHGAVVNGTPVVVAPLSGHGEGHDHDHDGDATGHDHDDDATDHDHHQADTGNGTDHEHTAASGCALVGIDGADGSVLWRDPVPPENCTIHSVADPTIADLVGDATPEAIVASTTETVTAHDPLTGEAVFEHAITEYGYTRPLVAEFDGDAGPELAVADVRGNIVVVEPDGIEVWRRSLGADVQAQPHAVQLDDDPPSELVVGLTDGRVVGLDDTGATLWTTFASQRSVIWQAAGQADGDPAVETVVAAVDGRVALVDDDGKLLWRTDIGRLAAVHAFGDGDGDGAAEVYAVNRNGTLRALATADGATEWETDVVPGEAQTTPPPVMGDLDGDGDPELAIATNAGRVVVLDPATGETLATWSRDVPLWTHPTLADLDGDGAAEVIVTYGDGRVAVLDYTPPE